MGEQSALPKRRRSFGVVAGEVGVVLTLYGLSVVPMIYWHDSGYMPDWMQDAIKLFYAPLHWVVVVTTGYGNG